MQLRGPLRKALLLCLAASLPLGAARPARTAELQVESNTLVRYFERDTRKGDDKKVLPVYEYLRVAAGELEDKGLSVHLYGWGRYDLADSDYFSDRSQGELLYGYLQYTRHEANFAARLGRLYVFEGVANESIDGLTLRGDIGPGFTLSAYGGLPVALETVDGRSGDRIWGGRLNHRWGYWYDVGLSYKRVDNDGDRQEQVLGVDSSVTLPWPILLSGFSARNLETDQWQEHAYDARINLGQFVLRPAFERFVYGAYFDTGANTGGPFRFLKDSNERVTVIGADVTWYPKDGIELQLKGKSYDYRERDDDAWYFAALAALRVQRNAQVGAEVGIMDGDTDDTRYSLWRAWFYCDQRPTFYSGDVVYVRYDADILGEDRSLFASLGAGRRFLGDALEVKLSGDYSADPYFDRDVRGMLAVKYLFSK
ncbi:MAG: hypothetical protein SCH98_15415 [Deferrisomatales bacterium]|nr:hypothetical protein [Deferrisomatales bacterium]